MSYHTEFAQQVIKVTEWRKGCVFRTKTIGTIWVHENILDNRQACNELAKKHGGDFLGSMPTNTPYDQFTRSVKDVGIDG